MPARIYLAVVGIMYLALALWCTMSPATTSRKVGFDLLGGSGRSEFMTVYGGLEFGLGLVFLLPWIQRDWTACALVSCILVHAALVLFRTASFFRYSDFEKLTRNLAVGEWVILLAGVAVWWFSRQPASVPG